MSINDFILIFIIAFILTVSTIPVVIHLANHFKIVDRPDVRKNHTRETPLLGGLIIVLVIFVITMIFIDIDAKFLGLLSGLVIITITGLIDDIWHLNPAIKFAGEIFASLIFIYVSGYSILSFGDLIGTGVIYTGKYAVPVTVFCMIGVMNAINMADGLDGLAAGICLIGCLFLSYFAWMAGYTDLFIINIGLIATLTGFLIFNRFPAKIFMGDTGSLVLGYLTSAICILLVQDFNNGIKVDPVSMAIIMGLPIVDALLVMTIRSLRGMNPFHSDKTHLHDRLLSIGFRHPTVVNIMNIAMFSCGVLAILLVNLPEWLQFSIGVIYAIVLFGSIYTLQFLEFKIR